MTTSATRKVMEWNVHVKLDSSWRKMENRVKKFILATNQRKVDANKYATRKVTTLFAPVEKVSLWKKMVGSVRKVSRSTI